MVQLSFRHLNRGLPAPDDQAGTHADLRRLPAQIGRARHLGAFRKCLPIADEQSQLSRSIGFNARSALLRHSSASRLYLLPAVSAVI